MTVNTAAWLFQFWSGPQPGENTPILTVYVPATAVDGTDQVVLNRVWPALSGWLSQTCWKTRASVGSYTSTSMSAVDAVTLFTVAVIEALPPTVMLLGATVAPLVYVGADVLVGTAVGVLVGIAVGVFVGTLAVWVGVALDVGVAVDVDAAVDVGVALAVAIVVDVGVAVGTPLLRAAR